MKYEVKLPQEVRGQGHTRHFRNGVNVTSEVSSLTIETVESESGVYIFYFDSSGNELNDLYFDSFALAARQVKFEWATLRRRGAR